MTTFLDGLAKGQTLMLRSAPFFLRVTRDDNLNTWDALDQREDQPGPHESIFLYYLYRGPFYAHIRITGKKRGEGGVYRGGHYKSLDPITLPDDVVRDGAKWAAWCERNGPRMLELLGDPRTRPAS